MSEAPIELEETGSKGRYLLRSEAGDVAEMTFSKAGERLIIIDHTGVPDTSELKKSGKVPLTLAELAEKF